MARSYNLLRLITDF